MVFLGKGAVEGSYYAEYGCEDAWLTLVVSVHCRFSAQDHAELWRDVTIPTVLALQVPGMRLKDVMDLEMMDLAELGQQYMEQED